MDEMATVILRGTGQETVNIPALYRMRSDTRVEPRAALRDFAFGETSASIVSTTSFIFITQFCEASIQSVRHGQAELLRTIVHMGAASRRTIVLAKPHRSSSKLLLDRLVLFILFLLHNTKPLGPQTISPNSTAMSDRP